MEQTLELSLILGGARSGKSLYAEKLAKDSGLPVTYIATAQIYDDAFGKRIQQQKADRPTTWRTVEVAHKLADTLEQEAKSGHCLIVDCLTTWLAQCICPECAPADGVSWQAERQALISVLPKLAGKIIVISNEVGMGIVPLGEINHEFQNEQGRLNQEIAALSKEVFFIAAGLPLQLK